MKKPLIFSLILSACSQIENGDFGDGSGTGSGEDSTGVEMDVGVGEILDVGLDLPNCEVIYQPKCSESQSGQCPGACILDDEGDPLCVESGVEEDCICESGHADGEEAVCEAQKQICISDGLDMAECVDVGGCPAPNQGLGCPCDPVETAGYCADGYTCLQMEDGYFCGPP